MSNELICAWCGRTFRRRSDRGPIPTFCSAAHRQAAHRAAKLAEQALRGLDTSKLAEQALRGLDTSKLAEQALRGFDYAALVEQATRGLDFSKLVEQANASLDRTALVEFATRVVDYSGILVEAGARVDYAAIVDRAMRGLDLSKLAEQVLGADVATAPGDDEDAVVALAQAALLVAAFVVTTVILPAIERVAVEAAQLAWFLAGAYGAATNSFDQGWLVHAFAGVLLQRLLFVTRDPEAGPDE